MPAEQGYAPPPGPQQMQGAWAGGWQGQPMAAMPPGQWGMPAGPGAATGGGAGGLSAEEQAAAALYQQQAWYLQQMQAAQAAQAYYYQQARQAAAMGQAMGQVGQGEAALHADEPLFAKQPMPAVPVALDPSGRPFKVSYWSLSGVFPASALPALDENHACPSSMHPLQLFHGIAARRIHRPSLYQSDGRPAWSR